MRRLRCRLLLCWLALILAACSPAAPLPAPVVSVTRAAPTAMDSPIPQSPVSVPPISASPVSDPPQAGPPTVLSLMDLAAQAYGPRLVVSLDIPAIAVHTPVVAVGWTVGETPQGRSAIEWDSPGALAGWVLTSALPGDGSNIVLYGHNNLYTSVFKDLGDLKNGDEISLLTGEGEWTYVVSDVLFLRTAFADEETLESYDKFLQPGTTEQLTLISCWPPVTNTHRVVVLADPVE